jgi:hypothetical protein
MRVSFLCFLWFQKRPSVEMVASTGSRSRKIYLRAPALPAANRLAQLFCRELGLMAADKRHATPLGKDICPPHLLGLVLEPLLKPCPLQRLGCIASTM